jgi:hypothetical protein
MKNPKIIITVMAALFLIFVFGCNKEDDTQTDSNPVEVDYTKLELGIKGEGLVYFGQTSSWDKILSSRIPMEAGSDLLEYNFGLFYLSEGCNFLISDNEATSDFYSIGYSNVSITGDDADSLHSAPNNGFTVANAGEYYLKFFINTSNHKLYLKVEKRIEIILDGTYIMGSGTALESFDNKSRMTIARNEVTQEDRSELVEKYIAVKAGSEGFNIYVVDDGVTTKLGPGSDFAVVTELDHNEPTLGLWRGQITETETPFTVPEDGLYHIAYDTELNIVSVARVVWGIIGAATPGGWAESTQLSAEFDLTEMTFTKSEVILTKADFKFRYSNGWKVIIDANYDLGYGNTGIKVNANLGGELSNLIPGGWNLINDEAGIYTITILWSLESGISANLEKTGDMVFDYSDVHLGLIGDGLIIDGNQQSWDNTHFLTYPNVTNDYIYTWNFYALEVTTNGSFKIREGQDWNGKSIGYPDVVMGGTAAADFETNGDGNFVPTVDGTYDIELVIDALTETYNFNVKASGTADPELFMLGDGTTAGWDNTAALAMMGTGGLYTITSDLTAGGNVKFITTLGAWAPQYGTDADGTAAMGNLVYRETESDPDPASIPVDADGTYVITAVTSSLTYMIDLDGAKLYVPGNYQGWDPGSAPMLNDGDGDGVFVGFVNMTEAGEFKFASQPNWDGPNYGDGGAAGVLSDAGDAGNLTAPEAGIWKFTVDVNNLTYTAEKQ